MNKRHRGRNRRPNHNPNRSLDSNGPDIKVRGSAKTVYDKYITLARDATSSGSRVKAENYLQHAEHYLRVMLAQQEKVENAAEQNRQNKPHNPAPDEQNADNNNSHSRRRPKPDSYKNDSANDAEVKKTESQPVKTDAPASEEDDAKAPKPKPRRRSKKADESAVSE